jgi:hypothetical protein
VERVAWYQKASSEGVSRSVEAQKLLVRANQPPDHEERCSFFKQIEGSPLTASLPTASVYGLRRMGCIFSPCREEGFKLTDDSLGFAMGRALVVLNAKSTPGPFPTTIEQRLLSLLYSRAKAHRL